MYLEYYAPFLEKKLTSSVDEFLSVFLHMFMIINTCTYVDDFEYYGEQE